MTNQQFKGLHQRLYDVPGTSVEAVGMGWDSSMLFGLGVGYKFNDWFRADVTGEYRGKANFHGSDNVTFTGGDGVDNYSGSKSEWVFMANAYVDLGTWWCVTPYVGAGIGTANIKINGFRDDGFTNIGGVHQLHRLRRRRQQMEFRLGAARRPHLQGDAVDEHRSRLPLHRPRQRHDRRDAAFDGSFTNGGPFTFNHITSHDFKLGVRWMLEAPAQTQPMIAAAADAARLSGPAA